MKPIGVFGGTFDPVHYGHILPTVNVCDRIGIDEVRYIPNFLPPHRGRPQARAKDRWNMLVLALAQYPQFVADDREIRRSERSYTVPTLRSLRSQFPFRPLCLILGMDAFLQIQSWHSWASVLQLANIVVMQRPGFCLPHRLPDWWERAFEPEFQNLYRRIRGCIVHVEVEQFDISASNLRSQLARGLDTSQHMPKCVVNYIKNQHLYNFPRGGI